ncbi:YkvA family protein [Shewanella acanthi]|uniref:YkvA family protein n=1 Tax=Shewanella acanthi TaxID=2864212 RepID=UPI001C658AFD|nr:YkvA family protein [Shewanella acanthi]QYJ78606.1 DUF1232 domain-containing protein [Shewanella acanthi]
MVEDEYTETGFWNKIKLFGKQAGRDVVERALWLYYAAQQPNTPAWAKSVILGALAYFISPIDAIPDLTPLVGFTDDLGALAAAITMVTLYIDDGVKTLAKEKLVLWFGDDAQSSKNDSSRPE